MTIAKLPIHSYLKKFVYWYCGLEYNTPIDLRSDRLPVILINQYIEPKRAIDYDLDKANQEKYNDHLPVLIKSWKEKQYYINISQTAVSDFNRIIRKMLLHEIYNRQEMLCPFGFEKSKVVEQSLIQFGIDPIDEWYYDNVRKAIDRIRLSMNKEAVVRGEGQKEKRDLFKIYTKKESREKIKILIK